MAAANYNFDKKIEIVREFQPPLDFESLHPKERRQLRLFGLGWEYAQSDGSSYQMILYKRNNLTICRYALYNDMGKFVDIVFRPMTYQEYKEIKLEKVRERKREEANPNSALSTGMTYRDARSNTGVKRQELSPFSLRSITSKIIGCDELASFSDGTFGAKVKCENIWLPKEYGNNVNVGVVLDEKFGIKETYTLFPGMPLLSGEQFKYLAERQEENEKKRASASVTPPGPGQIITTTSIGTRRQTQVSTRPMPTPRPTKGPIRSIQPVAPKYIEPTVASFKQEDDEVAEYLKRMQQAKNYSNNIRSSKDIFRIKGS